MSKWNEIGYNLVTRFRIRQLIIQISREEGESLIGGKYKNTIDYAFCLSQEKLLDLKIELAKAIFYPTCK